MVSSFCNDNCFIEVATSASSTPSVDLPFSTKGPGRGRNWTALSYASEVLRPGVHQNFANVYVKLHFSRTSSPCPKSIWTCSLTASLTFFACQFQIHCSVCQFEVQPELKHLADWCIDDSCTTQLIHKEWNFATSSKLLEFIFAAKFGAVSYLQVQILITAYAEKAVPY